MPRIGPLSDFYGVVIAPTAQNCTGIITNPARSLHEWQFQNSGLVGNVAYPQGGNSLGWTFCHTGLGGSAITVDTDGFSDFTDDACLIPAGLGGYYRFDISYNFQFSGIGPRVITYGPSLFVNGGLIFSDLITLTSPSGNFTIHPPYFRFIAIIQLNVGDKLTGSVFGLSDNIHGSATGGILAADGTLVYLGS